MGEFVPEIIGGATGILSSIFGGKHKGSNTVKQVTQREPSPLSPSMQRIWDEFVNFAFGLPTGSGTGGTGMGTDTSRTNKLTPIGTDWRHGGSVTPFPEAPRDEFLSMVSNPDNGMGGGSLPGDFPAPTYGGGRGTSGGRGGQQTQVSGARGMFERDTAAKERAAREYLRHLQSLYDDVNRKLTQNAQNLSESEKQALLDTKNQLENAMGQYIDYLDKVASGNTPYEQFFKQEMVQQKPISIGFGSNKPIQFMTGTQRYLQGQANQAAQYLQNLASTANREKFNTQAGVAQWLFPQERLVSQDIFQNQSDVDKYLAQLADTMAQRELSINQQFTPESSNLRYLQWLQPLAQWVQGLAYGTPTITQSAQVPGQSWLSSLSGGLDIGTSVYKLLKDILNKKKT